MDVTAAVHPTDQTLKAYASGKLEATTATSGQLSPGLLCRVPRAGGRDIRRYVPGQAP